ncbi:MAG: hypothetical protein JW857_00570 [Bacteroidales bacterium]|nr:hypothetical protein [Bacteroidales bacterium]
MKKYIGIGLLILLSINVFAQGESFSSSNSNFAGVHSVLLNPAAMHNQKTWLSFNLGSLLLFAHSDFIYLAKEDFRLRDIFDSTYVLPDHPTYDLESRPFYSYERDRNTSMEQSTRILGPSLMLSYNQHAFAITTAVRMESNIRNITPDLGDFIMNGFRYFEPYTESFQVKDFNVTTMSWAEIGFSYAYRLNNQNFDGWSFGVSVKRLFLGSGAYLNVDHSTYTFPSYENLDVLDQQAQLGFSLPIDYDSNDYNGTENMTGRGWSFDIGFTYQSLLAAQPNLNAEKFCEQPILDYKYRIGVALLDVGALNFKTNAQTHDFTTFSGGQGLSDFSGIDVDNINRVIATMSYHFYGDSTESKVQNTMRIGLPMALSIQADYNTEISNIYWSASLIYGFRSKNEALRRPSQLTLAPRYETKLVEVSIPFSLYQFKYPHLGVYARVGPLGIGSDWFSSLLGNRDFNGLDFYFTLKFQLSKDNCRKKRRIEDACRDFSS